MILEIERHHLGVGRNRVDALFASGAEQLQAGQSSIFGLSNLGVGEGSMT